MKILVTGGTGVIGSATVPALLRAGHDVKLLSRHADRDVREFPQGVEAFAADIADPRPLLSAVSGCDAVVHLAGIVEEEPPEVTFEMANVDGTRHLLAAAGQAGAVDFIYVSSLGAERGESAYHESKRRAEALVRAYAGRWMVLRPGNVYGPGDETISMLLKMMRTLPAVPVVSDGKQLFQPLWCEDMGEAIARAVADEKAWRQVHELAGPDVTTTNDVLDRLAKLTEKNPPRVPVPAWLAQAGAQAMEAFGGLGKRLVRQAGLKSPVNPATVTMLLEGNVLTDTSANALTGTFGVEPTSLARGLEKLADLLPEQMPGDGVGAWRHATYAAEIRGSRFDARELIARVAERVAEVMPMEFAAEPGAPTRATEEGATLTGDIAGRGHFQVRLEERTENRLTFVTLEGHPLAGVMQFHAEELEGGVVRFSVHTATQAANAVDWVGMKLIGEQRQRENWTQVVERVVRMTGGNATAGVRQTARVMGEREKKGMAIWIERVVGSRARAASEAEVAAKKME